MEEEFKPGHYTALVSLNIRAAMNTYTGMVVGGYRMGEPFTVYQVYPEVGGIVWGRVSSNTGSGAARYVALRVNNHPKAKLEAVFEQEPIPTTGLLAWAVEADKWMRLNGFKGPKPSGE